MKFNCTNDEAERNIKVLQVNLKEGQTLEDVSRVIYWFQPIINWYVES